MSLASTPCGLWFPQPPINASPYTGVAQYAMAASGAINAYIGYLYIDGRATGKVLSQAGGGKIFWLSGSGNVFANAGTTVDVGIQGVDVSTGVPVRPNLTFSTKKTLTGGTDSVPSSTWQGFAMGTGSVTLNHGDLVAIVFNMTGRGGSDTFRVVINQWNLMQGATGMPANAVSANSGSTWSNLASTDFPGPCHILFDDGTLGTLQAIPGQPLLPTPVSGGEVDTFANGTNPNERGTIFQVPWDCKVDMFQHRLSASASTGDMTWTLYSDPLGLVSGPTSVWQLTVNAEELMDYGTGSPYQRLLSSEISLSKNTNYCFAIKATGAGSVNLGKWTLQDAAQQAFFPGGINCYKATRNGATAFAAESPKKTIYKWGLRISELPPGPPAQAEPCLVGGTLVR
jgi:hypothetical protein